MNRSLIRPANVTAVAALALSVLAATAASAAPARPGSPATTTPIKHVVVIIGENHTFDNVFATYQPPRGQHIWNLLSEGIVTKDGNPGPNYARAAQLTAVNTKKYTLTPKITGKYPTLPAPNTTYVAPACDGLPANSTDTRFPADLPNGPFQITQSVPYFDSHVQYSNLGQCEFFGAYTATRCTASTRCGSKPPTTTGSPPGWPTLPGTITAPSRRSRSTRAACRWASTTWPRATPRSCAISRSTTRSATTTTRRSRAAPGANHIALGTGFAASYQDASGQATAPPAGEIENPNPKPGTNNNYTQDGYGSSTVANAGGSYSECADRSQPGVGPIFGYLSTLPYPVLDNCQPGRYYLLNNYNPGYPANGALQTAPYTVPPQKTDYVTIGNELSAHGISWGYFGEGYNNGNPTPDYCGICDPMQYSASIMTNPVLRSYTQHDSNQFIADAATAPCPRCRFLKPGDDDGHPGYSTLAAFENFAARAIAAIQSNRRPLAVHRDLRDDGRGRRLLRLRVHPAGQLLRRRSPDPDAGDLAVRAAGLRRPHLHRSRLDPEVHRGQLGAVAR